MKLSAIKKYAEETIADRRPCRNWDEATIAAGNRIEAERLLVVLQIAEGMTEDEKQRLRAVPPYRTVKNHGNFQDLKTKYKLSWGELQMLTKSDI